MNASDARKIILRQKFDNKHILREIFADIGSKAWQGISTLEVDESGMSENDIRLIFNIMRSDGYGCYRDYRTSKIIINW